GVSQDGRQPRGGVATGGSTNPDWRSGGRRRDRPTPWARWPWSVVRAAWCADAMHRAMPGLKVPHSVRNFGIGELTLFTLMLVAQPTCKRPQRRQRIVGTLAAAKVSQRLRTQHRYQSGTNVGRYGRGK